MKPYRVIHLAIAAFTLATVGSSEARVEWPFEEGDAYSRVVCRVSDDTEGAYKEQLVLEADEEGFGPRIKCGLVSYEIVRENGLRTERRITDFDPLRWETWSEGLWRRRYFVLPEVCFEASDTWRCRKLLHEKGNWFELDLPGVCPYRVKIGASPIVTTFVTNQTQAPLEPPGTMILPSGEATSNPFAFHPDLGVDGAYYRDLAVIDVVCGQKMRESRCGDGILDPGEICDDGNRIDDDGCTNDCQIRIVPPFCGDGVLQPAAGETCEIGSVVAPIQGGLADRACRDTCSYCGDGVLQVGEECDDGNDDDEDACSNDCTTPEYRRCRMFRDPSFSRDQAGNPRLKANGRLDFVDVSVAGPTDDPVLDLANEYIAILASTPEEGVVFYREFPPGTMRPYRDGGNDGYESGKGTKDEFKLKINADYTRFNLELPAGAALDDLLTKVEAGQVDQRHVTFQIRFEQGRLICGDATTWKCKSTSKPRGSCRGKLE